MRWGFAMARGRMPGGDDISYLFEDGSVDVI